MHTTADDPTKYRSEEEVKAWERKDPLTRFAAYLREEATSSSRAWTQAIDAEIAARRHGASRRSRAADPLAMFDHAYAELPPELAAERARGRSAGSPRATRTERHRRAAPPPPMRGQRMSSRWQS